MSSKLLTFPIFGILVARGGWNGGFVHDENQNPSDGTMKTISEVAGPPLYIAQHDYASFCMVGTCFGVDYSQNHFTFLTIMEFQMPM